MLKGIRASLGLWKRREDGVVAVEFAMISIPFLVLLVGIVETALYFASSIVLEGASAEAARLIRTGELNDEADPEQAFEDRLCYLVSDIMDCDRIQYEAIAVAAGTFASADTLEPEFDAEGNLIPSGFDTGDSEDVIIVRSYYKYEFLTPLIGSLMTQDLGRDYMMLMSTAVIKNEPYSFGT